MFHLISNRLKTLTTRAEFLVYLDEKTSSNTKYLVGKFDWKYLFSFSLIYKKIHYQINSFSISWQKALKNLFAFPYAVEIKERFSCSSAVPILNFTNVKFWSEEAIAAQTKVHPCQHSLQHWARTDGDQQPNADTAPEYTHIYLPLISSPEIL